MEGENNKHKRWKQNTMSLVGAVSHDFLQPYSIPVVPDELRKLNENAYIPKVVSIGTRYMGRKELMPMEEIKWRCMVYLLSRSPVEISSFDTCMEAILELDSIVRASYMDKVKLDEYDLATVMVFDGCFLLELLISYSGDFDSKLPSRDKYPSPAIPLIYMEHVYNDLLMVENQIPFHILNVLFRKLFVESVYDRESDIISDWSSKLVELTLSFYSYDLRPQIDQLNLNFNGPHLLEIVSARIDAENDVQIVENNKEIKHASIEIDVGGGTSSMKHLNRCATRLYASGIGFHFSQSIFKTLGYSAHVKNMFSFDLKFINGTLLVPELVITETMESKWRNFIAWEHHKKWKKSSSFSADSEKCCSLFTSSALLFSDLICCTADVQLLIDQRVIRNDLGMSNRDLAALFHSIAKGVDRDIIDNEYSKMFHALNTYSSSYYAILETPALLCHYFSRILDWIYNLHKFFRRGYNFAATMITLLAVVQTCYAIVAYHFPKN